MSLHSFLHRNPLSDQTRKRLAAASAEEDDTTADPEGDLASERYTRYASSEEFLTSLKKRM